MEYIQFTINIYHIPLLQICLNSGKIISTIFVLGNTAQLKARNSHKIIQAELTHSITWKRQSQSIIFWRNNLMQLNSYQVFAHFTSLPSSYCFYFFRRKLSCLIRTIFKRGREQICLKIYNKYKIKQSSKLFAIQFALQSFAPKIRTKSVCSETDYTAFLIVKSESNKAHWQHQLTWYPKS